MVSDAVLQLSEDLRPDTVDDISALTGMNLRRLRTRRGFSLDRLAKISGVSRAMLGQIETGKSSPTISILAKIAAALEVPCGSLIAERAEAVITAVPRAKSKILISSEGKFRRVRCFRSTAIERWNSTKYGLPHTIRKLPMPTIMER
jgi:transcriptional regulator with XRE-family HTH domain